MKIKPITPDEVVSKKIECIPDEVIAAFNELIAEAWNGRSAFVYQDAAVKRISDKLAMVDKTYKIGYLDVEPIFEQAGWKVVYDKPGYNETGRSFFTFSKK
jgi:hypothetical protein